VRQVCLFLNILFRMTRRWDSCTSYNRTKAWEVFYERIYK
jgi:hypothetical protein